MISFHVLISPEMADCLLEIKPSPVRFGPKKSAASECYIEPQNIFLSARGDVFFGGESIGGGGTGSYTSANISLLFPSCTHTHTHTEANRWDGSSICFILYALTWPIRTQSARSSQRKIFATHSPPSRPPSGLLLAVDIDTVCPIERPIWWGQ